MKKFVLIVLVGIAILSFYFYWYEWRSSEIRKQCWKIAPSTIEGNTNKNYEACLRDHGLKI